MQEKYFILYKTNIGIFMGGLDNVRQRPRKNANQPWQCLCRGEARLMTRVNLAMTQTGDCCNPTSAVSGNV